MAPITFDATSSQGHQLLLAMDLMSSETENIFSSNVSLLFLKHAYVECNFSGKGPVLYSHDPRWIIPECPWETFACNEGSNESAKGKGPSPRPLAEMELEVSGQTGDRNWKALMVMQQFSYKSESCFMLHVSVIETLFFYFCVQ